MPEKKQTLEIDGRKISVSNLDKVLYPAGKFTKRQVIDYYVRIAPYMLPHLKDRPITLKRFPDGVRGQFFYEKDAPSFTPDWVRTFPVPRREGGRDIRYIVVDDVATLAWLANIASLEIHPFLHRVPRLDQPAAVVFDLDPGEGSDVLTCVEAAFLIKDVLGDLGLQCFPKVSGSKGIQLYIPLNTPTEYKITRPFAKAIADLLCEKHPDLVVSTMAKRARTAKVFIDWSQNSDFKTTVGVYSLRAKSDRPFVSAPVRWIDLKSSAMAKNAAKLYFSPQEVLLRLERDGDLFEPVLTLKQRLPEAVEQWAAATRRPKPGSSLATHEKKRDFGKTPEPEPKLPRRSSQGGRRRCVIQKHEASHLHYDFRLRSQTAGPELRARRGSSRLRSRSGESDPRSWRVEPNLPPRGTQSSSQPRSAKPNLRLLPQATLDFVEPMLAKLVKEPPEGPEWSYELKPDGFRCLVIKKQNNMSLFSRRRNRLNGQFPVLRPAFKKLPSGAMLDGEVVAMDKKGRPSFKALQNWRAGQPLYFYAFDVLAYREKDVRSLPLSERRRLLEAAVSSLKDPVRLSPVLHQAASDLVTEARGQGLEGIVAKRTGSAYESGKRSGAWTKVKTAQSQELVIGGYIPGPHVFDSLLVGYYDQGRLMFLAKVRNGFVPASRRAVARHFRGLETDVCPFANLPEPKSRRQGKALTKEFMKEYRWLKPKLVAQVGFAEWTRTDHLRNASFLGLRNDKNPLEITYETAA